MPLYRDYEVMVTEEDGSTDTVEFQSSGGCLLIVADEFAEEWNQEADPEDIDEEEQFLFTIKDVETAEEASFSATYKVVIRAEVTRV